MKHFYDLCDMEREAIDELLALASRLQYYPEPRALEGKVLAMLFMSPSLRTSTSFQAAMARLGGSAFLISPNLSTHGMETHRAVVMDGRAGEHLRDAVPVIAAYGDALGLRLFRERRDLARDLADADYQEIAALVGKPLINLESAAQHPCQALAD